MAQAKRSPILGYNHNVKYRGVVFHVQTEDSGLLNPHLFTHLFHEGVIVSTRKLVYDAGSNEDAVKALMQAQHKAVMKDLRRGMFDVKIDQYLGHLPDLEPSTAGAAGASAAPPKAERAKTEVDEPPVASSGTALEVVHEELSEPIELPLKARAATGDQTRPVEMPRTASKQPPPPSDDIDPPTAHDPNAEMAAAVRAANAQPAQQEPVAKARTSTAQKVSRTAAAPAARGPVVVGAGGQSRPVIEITEEEISSRLRSPRDTAMEVGDGVPRDDDPSVTTPVRSGHPAHNAAALGGAKPAARPSLSPPVVTRPATGDRRRPDDSEAVEIYQPAPPSADVPPGERSERAGTYSVGRRHGDAPIREKTGRIQAIDPNDKRPPQLQQQGRPRPSSDSSGRVPSNIPREPTPASGSRTPTPSNVQRPTPAGTPRPGGVVPPRPGAPQGVRPTVTAPIQNRSSTPVNPAAGSNVVMTRPAVVVGAPQKPGQPPQQRVRKAREDEGRGFGQGLISEKSLDEVILAYLSEDADDK